MVAGFSYYDKLDKMSLQDYINLRDTCLNVFELQQKYYMIKI